MGTRLLSPFTGRMAAAAMLSFLAANTNNSTSTCNDFRIPPRVLQSTLLTRLGNQLMGLLQSNPCQHLQHRHLRSCSQRISCQHLKGQQLIYPCCKKQSLQHKVLMMPLLLQSKPRASELRELRHVLFFNPVRTHIHRHIPTHLRTLIHQRPDL